MVFQANQRELAEGAWGGDIVGSPNHGALRIADARLVHHHVAADLQPRFGQVIISQCDRDREQKRR